MANPGKIVDRQTLEQAVLTYLENDDATANDFSLFLQLTEEGFAHELKLEILEAVQTGSMVSGTAEIPLPSGFIEPIVFLYNEAADVARVIEYLPPQHFYDTSVYTLVPGVPTYYTIIGSDIVTRMPDADYAYTLHYYKKPDELVNPTDTNVLLSSSPELYLYACLAHGSAFFNDDANQARWTAMYEKSKADLHNADARKRYRAVGRMRPISTDDRAWKLV